MHRYPTPFADLWWSTVGAETMRHPAHGGPGGEWDELRSMPRRRLRSLTGARLLTPGGLAPDQIREVLAAALGDSQVPDTCTAVTWYVRHATLMVRENRRAAHWRRHHLLAHRHGYRTYWAYRSQPRTLAA